MLPGAVPQTHFERSAQGSLRPGCRPALIPRVTVAPEQLPGVENYHPTGTYHRPLLRFGIQTGPRPFLPEEEISKRFGYMFIEQHQSVVCR